jgi:glucose-6-phosphate-specific signal transduction histidine kinase
MKRYDLKVRVDLDQIDECAIPLSCAVLLFRSVRELLINTVKHAAVKEATVRLTCDKGLLQIVGATKAASISRPRKGHHLPGRKVSPPRRSAS